MHRSRRGELGRGNGAAVIVSSWPHRAEHVGSLLRPRELKDVFRAHGEGKLDDRRFRDIQDGAIRPAVALQEEVGLSSITDGEFRDEAGDVIRW
jgi:hypothetical protein